MLKLEPRKRYILINDDLAAKSLAGEREPVSLTQMVLAIKYRRMWHHSP